MPTPKATLETCQQTIAAVESALKRGFPPPGQVKPGMLGAIAEAARDLGIPRKTVTGRLAPGAPIDRMGLRINWNLYKAPPRPDSREPIIVPPDRDANFWRRRSTELGHKLSETEHALHQVAGLMERAPEPPTWELQRSKSKGRAIGLLHISDIHAGEIVSAVETRGVNEYDLEICRARLRRLFKSVIELVPRWGADCQIVGFYLALNGDLISGDLHAELRQTNAITSHQQVWFCVDELAAGIKHLLDAFKKIVVVVTTGNHGRSTEKVHSKKTADLSYDTMVGEALRRYFEGDKNVSVIVSPSRDAEYKIFNWRVLQTHHDQGGGGGQGFAGPILPIARKAKAAEWMGAQSRVFWDIILTAHHHASGSPTEKHLANGSIVGFSEYARSLRAAPEVPMQWAALIHERWCIRERMPIKLETPKPGA